MNKSDINMNKTNISILEYPQLRIESVKTQPLGKYWHGITLSGNYWRLYHNSTGGTGVWVKGKPIELRSDRIYLLPPNCGIKTWCHSEPYQFYIHFELSHMSGNPDYPCTEIELTPHFEHLIGEIKRLMESEKNSGRINLLCTALVADSMLMLPEHALSELTPDSRVSMICEYLRRNISEQITLSGLARKAGMAPNSFLRLFREITGITPYQYMLNLRYAAAARMLESENIGIDMICDAVGVKDRFHFSRRFKAVYGMPPAAYRSHCRK